MAEAVGLTLGRRTFSAIRNLRGNPGYEIRMMLFHLSTALLVSAIQLDDAKILSCGTYLTT